MTTIQQRLADFKQWIDGIPYEISFWKYTYRYPKRLQSLLSYAKLGLPLSLPGWDASAYLSSLSKLEPTILDVGCGMSYASGNLDSNGHPLNIHYVDALAQPFNTIKNNYQPSLPNIEFGMMEYLGAFYPQHDISLIIIQNALDHCSNPIKAILEALDALHIGGCLYLNHHPNEAEYEHYRGFHKFNICKEDSHLLIWNQTERINVNDCVSSFATVSCLEVDGNPVAILTKTNDVPQNRLKREQDIQVLCHTILYTANIIQSPATLIKKNSQIFYYELVQAIIQLFPWHIRQSIKKLINKTQ